MSTQTISADSYGNLVYRYEYDNQDGHPRQFTGTEYDFQKHLRRTGSALSIRVKECTSRPPPVIPKKPVQLKLF